MMHEKVHENGNNGKVLDLGKSLSEDTANKTHDDNNGDASFSLPLLELLQSCTTGDSPPFKSDYYLIGTVPVTYHDR